MNTNYEEQIKTWMADWRKRFEDMQVQFSLGKMDATDAFEKQKDLLRNAIVEWKSNLDKAGDKTDATVNEMKAKMEELLLQLNLGKAEGKELFEEQRKKIEAALHEIKTSGSTMYHEKFNDMMQVFDTSSKAFKAGLEILQLQFSLAKMDAKVDVAEVQAQVKAKMNEITQSFTDMQKLGMQNLEAWNKQMQDGYEKLKTMTEDWMKKTK